MYFSCGRLSVLPTLCCFTIYIDSVVINPTVHLKPSLYFPRVRDDPNRGYKIKKQTTETLMCSINYEAIAYHMAKTRVLSHVECSEMLVWF